MPSDYEGLSGGKWTRVNARACALMMQAFVEAVKLDLIILDRKKIDAICSSYIIQIVYSIPAERRRGACNSVEASTRR